jgi:hypothetical protein
VTTPGLWPFPAGSTVTDADGDVVSTFSAGGGVSVPGTPPPTGTLLGVFVSQMTPSTEEAAAAALGVALTCITEYGNNGSPYNYSPPAKGALGGARLVLGLGPCSTSEATTIAEGLIANGYANTIFRFCWEMNGNWYPWGLESGGKTTGWTNASYVAAWTAFHAAVTAVPGGKFEFLWNMNGTSNIPTGCYPGSALVDIIGTDQYSYSGYAGNLAAAVKFAQSEGKPFAICEWGCASGGGQTGDDPNYIKAVAAIIKAPASNCQLQMYFSDPSISGFPNAEAAYRAEFG